MITLRYATVAAWIESVLADFDSFLLDHAAAEKKASGMAISLLSHYPDKPALVKAMVDLSIEELTHFRDVVRIVQQRGLQLRNDEKDSYINQLRQCVRAESNHYFLDRLLTAGIIEARGCERFALVAEHVQEAALKKFYTAISKSEARHHQLFVDLAKQYFDEQVIRARLDQLLDDEARIAAQLPIRAALH